jgi:polar amino acid transport system substrate-binding protein
VKPPKSKKLARALFLLLVLALLPGFSACSERSFETSPAPQNTPRPPSKGINKSEKILRYAVFPAPPYMIGAGNEDTEMSGIDVDIAQEIAGRLKLQLNFIKCTWDRCLELMKNGEADLLSSAYKKPEREDYMLYFDSPYLDRLPIAFYSLKEKAYSIKKYEDIYQFERVGVLKGASYFERFDKDGLVKKFEVPSQDQLFPMLLAGRLDLMAGYLPTENYWIQVSGLSDKIERSDFEFAEQALVYMTISKKSPFAGRFQEFNQINQDLLKEGFIPHTIQTYYEKYR